MASVAIGVAAVVAVTFTTRSTQTAFDEIFQSLAGRRFAGDRRTDRPGNSGFGRDRSRQHPGVEAIAPRLQRPAIMIVREKDRVQLVAAAIDLERDAKVHEYKIVAGEP